MFGFGKKNTNRPEDPAAQRESITALAEAIMLEHGVETVREEGEYGPQLRATNHPTLGVFILGNAFDELMSIADRAEWRPRLERRIGAIVRSYDAPSMATYNDDDWRQRIRVRLIPEGSIPPEMQPVFRPFLGNLQIMLYRDEPETVAPVLEPHLKHTRLSVDELFTIGLENTHREPIEERAQVNAHAYAAAGQSFFISSKIIDLEPMVGTVFPAAPNGALVAIPNRNFIGFAPVTTDAMDALMAIAAVQNAQIMNQQEILTEFVFFWTPDGTIDIAAKISPGQDDRIQVSVNSGSLFDSILTN